MSCNSLLESLKQAVKNNTQSITNNRPFHVQYLLPCEHFPADTYALFSLSLTSGSAWTVEPPFSYDHNSTPLDSWPLMTATPVGAEQITDVKHIIISSTPTIVPIPLGLVFVCVCVCVCLSVCCVECYSCSRINEVQVRVSIGF